MKPQFLKCTFLMLPFLLSFVLLACDVQTSNKLQSDKENSKTTTTPTEKGVATTPKPEPPTPPVPPKPKKPEINWNNPTAVLVGNHGTTLFCDKTEVNILKNIQHYADSVQMKKLSYSQATANDCSGTFIRLNEYLNTICPKATFPSFKVVRSTRDLIKYYHDKKQLVFVKSPINSDSLIRPGTVMFYTHGGRGGKLEITPENMQSLVNHVGVVYSVERDEKTGVVKNYQLFHGQNPSKGIGITKYHVREPHGASSKPYPYGNGTEQWMAVAPIVNNR
jgi:hypothetical protein